MTDCIYANKNFPDYKDTTLDLIIILSCFFVMPLLKVSNSSWHVPVWETQQMALHNKAITGKTYIYSHFLDTGAVWCEIAMTEIKYNASRIINVISVNAILHCFVCTRKIEIWNWISIFLLEQKSDKMWSNFAWLAFSCWGNTWCIYSGQRCSSILCDVSIIQF